MDAPLSDGAAVTIAVVSWNTRSLLADCLQSLREDAETGFAQVWVLDNASADGSADLVRERFPWVRLIASSQNMGFGPAVNAIASRTSTPWVVPANADIEVKPGAVRRLIATGEQHPEVGVVAPRLILPDGTTQRSVLPFPTVGFTLAYVSGATRLSHVLARRWCIDNGFDPELERDVSWAVGAFLAVRRAAWEQIRGFDDTQWMYAEDLDLGWRLAQAGWRTRYVPAAEVLHAESAATTQAWGESRYARWHASTYAWLTRRRGLAYARLLALINVVGFLCRAAFLTLPAVIGSRRARTGRRSALNAARSHLVGLERRHVLQAVR